jgi:hypothetical protein
LLERLISSLAFTFVRPGYETRGKSPNLLQCVPHRELMHLCQIAGFDNGILLNMNIITCSYIFGISMVIFHTWSQNPANHQFISTTTKVKNMFMLINIVKQ